MRWLLHGQLEASVGEALRRHGHTVVGLSEVGLGEDAPTIDLLKAANARQLDILTASATLVETVFERDYWFGRSIVLLLVEGEVEQNDAIDRLFTRYKRLSSKRLYTVTAGRVKIRQLPGRP